MSVYIAWFVIWVFVTLVVGPIMVGDGRSYSGDVIKGLQLQLFFVGLCVVVVFICWAVFAVSGGAA